LQDFSGTLIKLKASNCVMGRVLIDGQPIVISGDVFQHSGGSAVSTIKEKSTDPKEMPSMLQAADIGLLGVYPLAMSNYPPFGGYYLWQIGVNWLIPRRWSLLLTLLPRRKK